MDGMHPYVDASMDGMPPYGYLLGASLWMHRHTIVCEAYFPKSKAPVYRDFKFIFTVYFMMWTGYVTHVNANLKTPLHIWMHAKRTLMCLTWLIHIWVMSHTSMSLVTHINESWHKYVSRSCCGTWLVAMCDMTHWCVWLDLLRCDMTHWHVSHDPLICVTRTDVLLRNMTRYYVCYDPSTCGDMTHSCVWHNSLICVTCLIDFCDITHSFAWHDPFRWVAWFIYILWCDRCLLIIKTLKSPQSL